MLSLEYVAGFFDGEGTAAVVLSRNKSPWGFRWFPWLLVTQKNPSILYQIRDRFNFGHVYKVGKAEMYQYRVSRRADVVSFADAILPFSFVKRELLILVKEAAALKKGAGNATSKDEALAMLTIAEKIRAKQIRANKYVVDIPLLKEKILSSGLDRNFMLSVSPRSK